MNPRKPHIVTVIGDLAGMGPELVGRSLNDRTIVQADIQLRVAAGEHARER
jgi:4-hydroxy-L-threonine phosphate dehydrogenase PdxA